MYPVFPDSLSTPLSLLSKTVSKPIAIFSILLALPLTLLAMTIWTAIRCFSSKGKETPATPKPVKWRSRAYPNDLLENHTPPPRGPEIDEDATPTQPFYSPPDSASTPKKEILIIEKGPHGPRVYGRKKNRYA